LWVSTLRAEQQVKLYLCSLKLKKALVEVFSKLLDFKRQFSSLFVNHSICLARFLPKKDSEFEQNLKKKLNLRQLQL
jgi:hypothetical protein